ncbi:MAG: ABC transporter permease subunit [Acidimicrobiia bacterium]|nr:ABC transporter permease subunit [Acidimicrobiia bacterium]
MSVVVVIALWEGAGRAGLSQALPPFTDVVAAFGEILTSDRFREAVVATFRAVLIGFPPSVVIGILIGTVMALYRPARWTFDPWVNLGLSLPLVSMIPVIIFVFGLGDASILAVVIIYTLPILIVNTVAGIESVNRDLVDMGKSFNAAGPTMFRRIILPGAAPLVLAGVRLAAGRAIKGAIIAEQIVGLIGLGGLIQRLGGAFAVDELYAMIIFVGIVGVVSVALLSHLEKGVAV